MLGSYLHSVYPWEAFPGFSLNPPFIWLAVFAVRGVNPREHNGSATHRDTPGCPVLLCLLALLQLSPSTSPPGHGDESALQALLQQ